MLQSTIQRAALGRAANIGALYDIRTESFVHDTVFGSKVDDGAIDTMDLGDTSIDLVMTDSLQDKFNKLDVEAELQVSLLAGLVKLSGSGAYLGEERKSARAQSMSLLCKLRTVNEGIMIRNNKDKIDLEILAPSKGQAVNATHVVVGIDWGAVCSVTCEYENNEDEDVTKVKGALKVELEKLKGLVDVAGSARAEYDDKNKENHKKYTFKCKADVSAPDKDLPITFEGAVELARNLPSLVKGTNNGKGVPMTYTLIPLDAVARMCKLQIQIQILYTSINEDIVIKCAQVVEGITKKRQALYDIQTDLHACADYVVEDSLVRIDDVFGKFIVAESGFKVGLQGLVKKVRSGSEDVSSLEAFLSTELQDAFPVSKYNDQIRGFQKDFNKVKSIKLWKNRGVTYIGKNDDFTVDDPENVYVLYKSIDEEDKENLDKNQQYFFRLQKTHAQDDKTHKFVIVDQEIRNDLWPKDGKATIHRYVSGSRVSSDLYAKECQDTEMCLIKMISPAYQQIRPSNRADVKLRCPNALSGNGQCPGDQTDWICSKCKQVVEYGIETKKFYCRCGESDPSKSLFRCSEEEHGVDYIKYPYNILAEELSHLRAMKEECQDTEMCLIKMISPAYQQIRPSNRADVKLRCPNALSGNGQCSGNKIAWICSKCKQVVEYGIETKLFYCSCGESIPSKSLFRCSEEEHGVDYVKYPDDILDVELSYHRAMKEINILILGETGVGKSTWINGFQNYLYFADLEEAINAEEFHALIPSSFIFTQQGKAKKISVGNEDTNENMQAGKSATREPRSYVFRVGEQKVRLIDTPGVGDSEGIEQYQKNFDNILSYLTYYKEIHAVCILLKPNNLRLTAMFRFCMAHLHSSAKDNIVFCFTNARGTFYQPGDTLPALNKELRERKVGIKATPLNYFCFDNESFRFLACLKNGVTFTQGDVNTYAESWNKSVEETNRLFGHINTLKPHKVKDTLNMNEARRIIVAMSKSLAEVAKTIQHNVHKGNEVKIQIEVCNKEMDGMKASLKFSGYGLKRTPLEYPRTVCAHSACVRHVPIGEEGVQNTIYEQICHAHCDLSGIPTETINDARVQGCWCIKGTTCHQCGHHYTSHMHITFDTEVFTEEFLSKEVQEQINQKKSVKEKNEAIKSAIDTQIMELENEREIIMKTSAKYGSFLKANAIIPYNDAVGDYLDMSIQQERNKAKELRNDTLLSTMETMKMEYEEERRILDGAIGTNTGNNINTPEEVMKLQKELFDLKHMGETLKDLFDGISISNSANNTGELKCKEILWGPQLESTRGTAPCGLDCQVLSD